MNKWYAIIPAAGLIVTVGCQDLPTAESLDQEGAEELNAEVATSEAAVSARQSSTVCEAFRAQLAALHERIVERPDDVVMQEAAVTLESIIPNTCD